ncbi:MAG: hypothetical protein JZU52_16270, partial [Lamprocystis purpurea]|nr:hypothetical protein [Lamprocystis purpurea]
STISLAACTMLGVATQIWNCCVREAGLDRRSGRKTTPSSRMSVRLQSHLHLPVSKLSKIA